MKYAVILFFIVLLIAPVYAEQTTIAPVKQGQCALLPQLELNSSYQNLTAIQLPNKTINLIGLNMTKYGYYYTYNFCGTNDLGSYVVNGCSDLSCWSFDFEVNSTGQETTIFQGLIYILALAILTGIFFLGGWGSFAIPSQDITTNEGEIMKINWLKYAKWGCMTLTWLCGVWILYICWNLSYAFAFFSTLENVFKVLFFVAMTLSIVTLPVAWVFGVIHYFHDRKWDEMIQRGLTPK